MRKKGATNDKKELFALSILRRKSRQLFDVSISTFDGATCELDQEKEYTIEEVKKTIDKWKGRRF